MGHTRIRTLFAAGLVVASLTAAPGAHAQETIVIHGTRDADRGWLGLSFAWEDDGPEQMRITQVFPGSPAADAGARRGDVVLRIGTRPATDAAMAEMRTRLSAGDTVRLRVRRDGGEHDLALVAAARPGAQLFAERILRLQGDSLRARTFQIDSTMVRMGSDSVFRWERDGRNMMISIRGDSLRALADSLLVRVDTLRRSITIPGRAGEGQVFAFPAPDSAMLRRMQETLRRLETTTPREGITTGEGMPIAEGRAFFLEVGRRALAGAELTPMNAGLARYFAAREGLLVTRVSPESPAGRAGLEAGDVVVRAGGQAVAAVGELREAVRRATNGRLPLEVMRGRRRQTVELKWDGETPGVRTFTRALPRGRDGAQRR